MNTTMQKIEATIKNEIGTEYELMVITYLFDKGFSFCQRITDEDIAQLEGNSMMSTDFVQSLVRCAKELANNFELIDIMKYVRCEVWMTPAVKEVRLWKADLSNGAFAEICEVLEVDCDEATEMDGVEFKVICEEV